MAASMARVASSASSGDEGWAVRSFFLRCSGLPQVKTKYAIRKSRAFAARLPEREALLLRALRIVLVAAVPSLHLESELYKEAAVRFEMFTIRKLLNLFFRERVE